MGDPLNYRESVRSLEHMLFDLKGSNNCVLCDVSLPLPKALTLVKFHAIIFTSTFLDIRYTPRIFDATLKKFDFLQSYRNIKIGLPQDDYDCSNSLDNLFTNWNFDLVYTVCPEHWDILYPKTYTRNILKLAFTGYIDEKWISSWANPLPYASRPVDICYRASKLPANFGFLGHLKWKIAHNFVDSLPPCHNLNLDISVDPASFIPGQQWHTFLESSRCTLVSASGSSIHDPFGSIRSKVKKYNYRHPNADFKTIKSALFADLDCKYIFTALSPRNIEAALALTVQIATDGSYSNLLKPFIHFLPLRSDCSNIKDILLHIANYERCLDVANACKNTLVNHKELHKSYFAESIFDYIETSSINFNLQHYCTMSSDILLSDCISSYHDHLYKNWYIKRLYSKFRSSSLLSPFRLLKSYLP